MELLYPLSLNLGHAVIVLAVLATLFSIRRSHCQLKSRSRLYEDQNGQSSLESAKVFNDRYKRRQIVACTICGLVTSIATTILYVIQYRGLSFTPAIVTIASWILIASQCALLFAEACPCHPRSYRVGLFIAISIGSLGLNLVTQLVESVHDRPLRPFHVDYILLSRAVQCLLALSVCLTCLNLPRRPEVYWRNELVDEQSSVSVLKNLSFSWAERLFDRIRSTSQIHFRDLPYLDHRTRASQLHRKFSSFAKNRRGPLWRAIYQSLRRRIWWEWFLAAVHGLALYAPQYCLFKTLELLEQYQKSGTGAESLWFWAAGIGVSRFVEYSLLTRLMWYAASAVEIPVKSQLSAMIFQKALSAKDINSPEEAKTAAYEVQEKTQTNADKSQNNKEFDTESIFSEADIAETVPLQDLGSTASEHIVDERKPEEFTRQGVMNLIAVDTGRVSEFASKQYVFVHIFVTFTVSVVFLVRMIGPLSLCVGLLAPAILMPLNMATTRYYAVAQGNLMSKRDEKIRVVTEALQAIRQIKFSATESQWLRKILGSRNDELSHQRNVFKWTVVLRLFWVSSPILLSVLALGTYVWTHGSLSAAVAFTSIEVFGNLEFALSLLPYGIMQALDARISCERIQEYLDREGKVRGTIDGEVIEFRDATVAWPSTLRDGKSNEKFRLSNVSCKFPLGRLSVIIGPSGSGKSLLLASIIDEAEVLSGTISVPRPAFSRGNVGAWQGDDTWLVPGTMACVTQIPWLENCSLRDNILFGLPLDQKRYDLVLDAANLQPDIGLLADGDRTEVGSRGVNFSGGQCWRIAFARALYSRAETLVLDDIFSSVDSGTALYILQRGLDGSLAQGRTRILATHHHALCLPRSTYTLRIHTDGRVEEVNGLATEAVIAQLESGNLETQTAARADDATPVHGVRQPRAFIEDEFRETGAVKASVYRKYIMASGGYLFWLVSSIFIVGSQVAILGRAYWVKIWTESDLGSPANAVSPESSQDGFTKHNTFYMAIYVVISMCAALGEAVKCGIVYHAGVEASRNLSKSSTAAILGAPLRWLDTIPVGRILNRFSADSATLDSKLPGDAHMLLSSIVLVIITALTSLGVSFYLVVPGVILLSVTLLYGFKFLHGAREVKRLESASRSPIMDLFESTLLGLSTIRAYARTDEYLKRMFYLLDNQSRSTWSLYLATQWMDFRMGAIGVVFLLMVALFVVLENVNPSLAGLVLSFSFRYTAATEEVINRYANVELNMNATERIVEFSEITQESRDGFDAPQDWPQHGEVSIEDLYVSYDRSLDDVLKGLTFQVSSTQRVGIVGRTGAGKSSFALAMLRFLYQRSGSITIDGIDISQVRIEDLRSRVTLIPQDPKLFSGTLRSNLDPLTQYHDETIQHVLRRVHLIASLDDQTSMFNSLELKISEGGLNLSQGQRQLVCLARALLTRSKVMIIDEATSSVDVATDALIQKSIREEFHDSTLLVIAHRLRTVADFDNVIVIESGRLCEFGTPHELFKKKGHFWAMVQDSGESDALETIFQRQETFP